MSSGTEESVHLHYQDAKSDKEYKVFLAQKDGGWVVNFAYGRRGSTLKDGCKSNKGPTDYDAAKKLFDKTVQGQLKDGYKPVGESAGYFTQADQVHSGVQCQLLNPVEEAEAQRLIEDPEWVAQEKKDGKRLLLRKSGDAIEAINRKGLLCGYPLPFQDAARAVPHDFVIDGEAIGEVLHVFDILELDGRDLRPLSVRERLAVLAETLGGLGGTVLVLIETAVTTDEKRALYDRLKAECKEGVVFKRVASAYVAGRPNSGGNQLKYKFYETCSAVVDAINEQRSVAVKLIQGEGWVSVGNVTIPANFNVPVAGVVVEIRYLYAYQGGSLYQPVYLGERSDIDLTECTLGQLKYKAA